MNPASLALVDYHARGLLKQLQPSDSRLEDRQDLSVGRLMQSMAAKAGVRVLGKDIPDNAKDEWTAAFANAAILSTMPDLQGIGGQFASRFGFRDAAMIDWPWLRVEARTQSRTMATTPGSAAGYLVGNNMLPAVDPLWQDSLIGIGGVQIIEGLSSSATIPRGTAAVTTTWQASERATAPTAVDAALGSISVTLKTLIANIQCSVQLLKQAPSVQDFLSRLLVRGARQAFDKALLQGSGASGEPQGLSNLPTASGIQQVSGTSLAWAGILNAQRLASASGVTDSAMLWVGAPTVRETLAARERVTGGGRFLWDDGRIAGSPALATPDAPASTLFVGDFSRAVLALFGPGVEIRFDPKGNFNFNNAFVTFQLLAMVDIVFVQPAAWVRVASIT